LTEPVFEYAHDGSTCAITGGYVVRDQALAGLYGRYLYADLCAAELRAKPRDPHGQRRSVCGTFRPPQTTSVSAW
jgi:hypothetical protein